ncbi:N-acetyltransferase [Lichenibacterium minor]|uniref:N-acetyltransferase n=1 Tax=Lichenibacterium minor TaxID=2316528 RepID=A0A4Q2UDC6_9HYPH|nr:GNAT family protein [Lichenibacterium minor]RYC33207.1 N-acetyltransferase [Lichenibacterium minor]
MFPEISREDIFRIETRRLWLRCPQAFDVAAAADASAPPPPEAASGDPYRTAEVLRGWRAGNATGAELHFLLTGRGADRSVLGAVDLEPVRGRAEACGLRLRVWLDGRAQGQGLATEAVQAMVDAAFMLTATPLVSTSARVLDPAFRRVVEKCGFSSCGTGLDPAPDGRGLTASDRFRLDRKAWASLKSWRVPGLPQARVDGRVRPCL